MSERFMRSGANGAAGTPHPVMRRAKRDEHPRDHLRLLVPGSAAVANDQGCAATGREGPVSMEPTGDAYLGRNGLAVSRLAAAIQRLGQTRVGVDQRLYHYDAGLYRPDGEQFVTRQVRWLLGDAFRRSGVAEVVSWLKADEPSLPIAPNPAWLNVANGLLDWRTGQLYEHTSGIPSTIQLPVAWRPEAQCPRIRRFLAEVLPPDGIDFVLEIIGYATYADNPLHKAVLFYGPGRNGKGTLLRIIAGLLGAANVSTVSLHALQENRFAAAELVGKLANICGDLDARAVRGSDVFKQITGGDAIYAERKHGQPFAFTPIALPLFSANQYPPSTDQSEGWFSRWLTVPMPQSFAGKEDPGLTAALTTPEELAGLLVLAVDGLQRLMARGRFDPPASVRDATAAHRAELDDVRAFIQDRCRLEPMARTKRSTLYQAYGAWCAVEQHRSASRSEFFRRLRAGWPDCLRDHHANDGDYFLGIELHEE